MIIPTTPLLQLVNISALSGHVLSAITHKAAKIHLVIVGNHHEEGEFPIIFSSSTSLIVCYPWLKQHNHDISWKENKVEEEQKQSQFHWSSIIYDDASASGDKLRNPS